jgi:predicted lipoprotein with Yx(FWY)xxD motif
MKTAAKTHRMRLAFAVGALLAAASLASAVVSGASQARSVAAHARLVLKSSPYGKVLFDPNGRVLYLFAADQTSRSTCYGECAKAWPPFLTKGKPTVGPGLKAGLVGTTRRKDGSLQVTYNRHPLYYFEEDKRGEIMCQHVNLHGGFWFVVKANGTANTAKSKTHM